MRTRTRLTTPPDQAPSEDERPGGEAYVAGPDLPREPRVASRHRGKLAALTVTVLTILVIAVMVITGEQAQREDPSIPARPGTDDSQPELPES